MDGFKNSILIHRFDVQLKDIQTVTWALSLQHGTLVEKIRDIHLLFWQPTISLASLAVCDWGGRMAARLSDSLVFVYPK